MLGINVAIITLICGNIFNQNYEQSTTILDLMLLIILITLNIIFITQWAGLLIISLGEKYMFLDKVFSNTK